MFIGIIPVAERAYFKMYAAAVLEGPALEPTLRLSLVLVLLLRHEAVCSAYPTHRLVLEMKQAQRKCNIADSMFESWISNTRKYNAEVNNQGLTLHQVTFVNKINMAYKFLNKKIHTNL